MVRTWKSSVRSAMQKGLAVVGTFAILVAACTDGGEQPTTIASTTTTSTFAPIEIVAASTTIAPGVDPAVYDQLTDQIRTLMAATQSLRGLSYIQVPDTVILAFDDFADRMASVVGPELTNSKLAREEAVLRLLGQYDEPPSIAGAMRDLYTAEAAIAFYDGAAAQVVVDGTRAELTPLEASIVVHALAAALIDQYHNTHDRLTDLTGSGQDDALDAFRTLADGDAIAVQVRYLQSLSQEDQLDAASQATGAEPAALLRLPDVVRAQLALPGEAGVAFVDEVVSDGGYVALDLAYDPPPQTMEQVLHPDRFAIRETVRDVPELAVEIDGYRTISGGSYGEWRLWLLLQSAVPPGLVTQTAAGWGGDAYQLLVDEDEMVFVYIYGGDTEDDAIEVAQALLAVARGPMAAGDGVDSGGGVLWDGPDRYVFVDRIGDGLVFIVATSSAAGAEARTQVRVP